MPPRRTLNEKGEVTYSFLKEKQTKQQQKTPTNKTKQSKRLFFTRRRNKNKTKSSFRIGENKV